jgi:hypothetical protein
MRDTAVGRFQIKSGDVMGLVNDELMSVGQTYDEVTLGVLGKIDMAQGEIMTIYFGQDSSAEQAEALAGKIKALYPELEIEVHEGGQPYYPYILSLE